MIYHITSRSDWQQAQERGDYRAESLETEGFIHNSTSKQVIKVANAFYRGQQDLVLLCITPDKLDVKVVWEAPAHPDPDPDNPPPVEETDLFPHVYGPINLTAVVQVVDFPSNPDGTFSLPDEIID